MTAARRRQMGSAAVAAARAVGYVNAGTVEFIADEHGEFYLHGDEHPPAGRASGHRDDHRPRPGRVAVARCLGRSRCRSRRSSSRSTATRSRRASTPRIRRAISCRPPGASSTCAAAPSSAHVRIDSGVREGDEIGVYYDPMIAKLDLLGRGSRRRPAAAARRACGSIRWSGSRTNLQFLSAVCAHRAFALAASRAGAARYRPHRALPGRAAARGAARVQPILALAVLAELIRIDAQAAAAACGESRIRGRRGTRATAGA